jgi:hypothetical protein
VETASASGKTPPFLLARSQVTDRATNARSNGGTFGAEHSVKEFLAILTSTEFAEQQRIELAIGRGPGVGGANGGSRIRDV